MTDNSNSLPLELTLKQVKYLHKYMNTKYVDWCEGLPRYINKDRYIALRPAFVTSRYGQDMEINTEDVQAIRRQAEEFSRRTRFGQLRYINVAIATAFEWVLFLSFIVLRLMLL